jgi:CheY-like chemotaxis protein
MKVLLVDDESGVRITLRIALTRRGLDVAVAEGGPEALQLLGQKEFDWLVTDGHMKPMNGFELAKEARRLQPGIKTVMITGVYLQSGPNEGILKVFTKPIDDAALAAYLQHSEESSTLRNRDNT